MKHPLLFWISSAFLILGASSCVKHEPPPDPNCGLPDLVTSLELKGGVVVIGETLEIKNVVANLPSDLGCTNPAKQSYSSINAFYWSQTDSSWESISNTSLIIVEILDAGFQQEDIIKLIFNKPGQFLFKTACDTNQDVVERDESNNNFEENGRNGASGENNTAFSNIITVQSNPALPLDPSKPPVEIRWVSRRVY